jgi:FlaA1/EpsC-like NDP-sugar epimerase
MKPKIIIIGAGGHGRVVHDAILTESKYEVIGFADSAIDIGTIVLNDKKVISNLNDIESIIPKISFFIVAIGNNEIRKKIFDGIYFNR